MPFFLRRRRAIRPRGRFLASKPVAGSQALSGTAPGVTWTVPGTLALGGSLALVGTAPAATWTVSPALVLLQPRPLLGASASAQWRVAGGLRLTGGIAVGGSLDDAVLRLGLEIGAEVLGEPVLGGGGGFA